MTTVDKYLNKYLEGSITELEMKEFRDLLESEPQLQLELRQILDLRSLVHDDLLALNPPEFLSTNVRNLVGDQFAALAEVEEEERRRPVFFTERTAGSMVMAMLALVLVALAPTLIAPSGTTHQRGVSGIAALETTVSSPNGQGRQKTSVSLSGAQNSSVSVSSGRLRSGNRQIRNSATVAEETADIPDKSVAAAQADPDNGMKPVDGTLIEATPNQSAENLDNIALLEESMQRNGGATAFFPRLDVLLQSTTSNKELGWRRSVSTAADRETDLIEKQQSYTDPQYPDYIATTTVPAVPEEYAYEAYDQSNSFAPRIAFGFTVGAGALTHSSSSVALTQGAGYAAYSLSESNRIGIEAGGSKFRYTHTTYSQEIIPLAKNNTTGVEEWRSAAGGSPDNLGGVYQIYGTNGRGTGATGNGTTRPQSHPGSINDPTQIVGGKDSGPSLFGGSGSSVIQPPSSVNAIIRTHTYESDTAMGYGMLFYDRRIISLNKELNIRSRVGLGGTDGGMILDLRAYAAFATNQNVAVTLGVGGSALRELSQEGKLSANYGVQVGAEVGF